MQLNSLSDFLIRAPLRSAVAMPLGNIRGFYLDVVFTSGDTSIRLTGVASDLADRTEAFLLTVVDFAIAARWIAPEGKPGWEEEDLLATWDGLGLSAMWVKPRTVRYYFDPDDQRRGLRKQGPFDSAAALEFTGGQQPLERLVLYATPEYPCAVELALTPVRGDAILASLQEFTPQSVMRTPVSGVGDRQDVG